VTLRLPELDYYQIAVENSTIKHLSNAELADRLRKDSLQYETFLLTNDCQ
jgi:hypothetical protein